MTVIILLECETWPRFPVEDFKLVIFENGVLRKVTKKFKKVTA
jgi:hypothetical protein